MEIVLCLLLLQIKHLIVDWCWQPAYEWQNKGTYGHWGGVRHALKNAVGTGMCFVPFVHMHVMLPLIMCVIIMDFVIHYHVDWCKTRINKHFGWQATTHAQFWWLTGVDQFAHQITYLFLVWALL